MSSFMKQFISTESLTGAVSIEDIEEITPEEEVELVEAGAEAELVRRDIEQAVEASERISAVQDELQAQNEVAEGIMEANGGQLPTEAAAGIEAGRRAAAVALGLDPESEEGQAIVDQPQIDAMVRGEAQPATEDDNKSKGFIATLKKIWNWIVEKAKAFTKWVVKFTNIIPKKYKAVYNELKSCNDQDFGYAASELAANEEFANKYSGLFENGKLVDVDDKAKQVNKYCGSVKAGVIESFKIFGAMAKDKIKPELLEEFFTSVNKRIDKEIKDPIVLNGNKITVTVSGQALHVDVEEAQRLSKLPTITLKDALNAVNVGSIASLFADVNRLASDVGSKDLERVFKQLESGNEVNGFNTKVAIVAQKQYQYTQKLVSEFNAVSSKMVSMLSAIAKLSKRKAEGEGAEA